MPLKIPPVYRFCLFLLMVGGGGSLPGFCAAPDVIIVNKPQGSTDRRLDYSFELLDVALEVTRPIYGNYVIQRWGLSMSRGRQYQELRLGENLNVMVSPPKFGWEGNVIRVKFPIQKGIASIRLALLMDKNKGLLQSAKTLEDFKAFSFGSKMQWSTTAILRKNGLKVVTGEDYKGLFEMLSIGRFQVFPRGLNEVFFEYEKFKGDIAGLQIDQHSAMLVYLPVYYYVSAATPKIAERLEVGLRIASHKGVYDELFNRYFGDLIKQADLDKRHLVFLENPNLSADMFFEDKPYLLPFFNRF